MVSPQINRTSNQQKIRELVLAQSNGYGFLNRQFISENHLPICIQSVELRTQKGGKDAGKEKWWILCTAENEQGINETGYLTFDHSPNRDRFFQALNDDITLLPAHNLLIDCKKQGNGQKYYSIEMVEEDREVCPCCPPLDLKHPF